MYNKITKFVYDNRYVYRFDIRDVASSTFKAFKQQFNLRKYSDLLKADSEEAYKFIDGLNLAGLFKSIIGKDGKPKQQDLFVENLPSVPTIAINSNQRLKSVEQNGNEILIRLLVN